MCAVQGRAQKYNPNINEALSGINDPVQLVRQFESFGTKDDFNMVGINKVRFIKENLKINDFDYLGNSHKDLPIWKYCKRAIYTNVSQELKKTIKSLGFEHKEIPANFS